MENSTLASLEPVLAQPVEIHLCYDYFLMLKAFIPKKITWAPASRTLMKDSHKNDHGICPTHSEQLGFPSFVLFS